MSTIHLTPSLRDGAAEQAVTVLKAYYAPLSSPSKGFSGGQFDAFDPSGTRAASPDVFTAEDLIAVSLLSVHVTGRAALELLEHQSGRFSELLRKVGQDHDLVEVESTAADQFPVRALNNALRHCRGWVRRQPANC